MNEGVVDAALGPEVKKLEEIEPPDKDLNDSERKQFADLLKKKLSLNDLADHLVKLAGYKDTKRAPVALRAIQEINRITGRSEPETDDTTQMFVLPEGTSVDISITKPEK